MDAAHIAEWEDELTLRGILVDSISFAPSDSDDDNNELVVADLVDQSITH